MKKFGIKKRAMKMIPRAKAKKKKKKRENTRCRHSNMKHSKPSWKGQISLYSQRETL